MAHTSETLSLYFDTNKNGLARININSPKPSLTGEEIKKVMDELLSLGIVSNTSDDIVIGIRRACLTTRQSEAISF